MATIPQPPMTTVTNGHNKKIATIDNGHNYQCLQLSMATLTQFQKTTVTYDHNAKLPQEPMTPKSTIDNNQCQAVFFPRTHELCSLSHRKSYAI